MPGLLIFIFIVSSNAMLPSPLAICFMCHVKPVSVRNFVQITAKDGEIEKSAAGPGFE